MFSSMVLQGYALVVQNERGTEWSEGKHQFLAGARNDGYDTISWIIQQPWSNGRVGTIGCSSSAEHQLSLAAMNHPAHKAMIAMSAAAGISDIPGVSSQGLFYQGGVPDIGVWPGWYSCCGLSNRPKLPADISQEERVRLVDLFELRARETRKGKPLAQSLAELPSQDILRRLGIPETDFDTLITLSPADPHWRTIDFIRNGDQPRVPALHVNAWYDIGAFETVKLFEYLHDTPNQYLIMAPTSHCAMLGASERTMVGPRFVGDGRYDYADLFLKWFDHWLKDKPNDVLARPKVQAYLMGANVWKTYSDWPIPGAELTHLFLHSDGHANSRLGTGGLSTIPPGREPSDAFVSDPLHPVPSQGSLCCDASGEGAPVQDQASVELRNDVLVYSTAVLQQSMAVTGEIKGVLYVSSSTPDADLALKIVDVYPDGVAFNLYNTMLRLRYREGFDTPRLMTPGEVYRVEMAGLVTSNYFVPGHRIRIEIAASNFPNFERNLQTGGRNYDETKPAVATIEIHHSADHSSFIELPVVAR